VNIVFASKGICPMYMHRWMHTGMCVVGESSRVLHKYPMYI
jgi:hypothetical protein